VQSQSFAAGKLLLTNSLGLNFTNEPPSSNNGRAIVFGKNTDPTVTTDWVEISGSIINTAVGGTMRLILSSVATATQGRGALLVLSGSSTLNGPVSLNIGGVLPQYGGATVSVSKIGSSGAKLLLDMSRRLGHCWWAGWGCWR